MTPFFIVTAVKTPNLTRNESVVMPRKEQLFLMAIGLRYTGQHTCITAYGTNSDRL
jgi:hypothetical protein